tara:strand:+ start:961 stop:1119 length:159 start_codon:yes stop_codon:yes gene_type:complete
MKLNNTAWDQLKEQIQMHLDADANLTDIIINYQIKDRTFGSRNFLKLNAKLK